MLRRSLLTFGATALVASMALTGCGERGSSSSDSSKSDSKKTDTADKKGDSKGSGDSKDDAKTLVIGVIAPISGDLSALGLGIRNSVDLAVKQANESGSLGEWKLKVVAEDDEAKPDVGRNAATKLGGMDNVIGVVGPLNSSVGQTVQKPLDDKGIAVVSPANTNPALTKGKEFDSAPKRQFKSYFRTCTTDDVQGPFAAKYLFDSGIKEIATIHDNKAYGKGLVDAFSKKYKELGGKIVAEATINPQDENFTAVISTVKAKSPKAVYYGGEFPQAGPLSKQMKANGLNVPLMGGDGIFSPKFVELAGKTSNGDLATSVGAPTDTLPSAKKFIADYKAGGYSDDYEAYGAYSFDAANAIIKALKAAKAKDAKSAREGVVKELSNVSFDGVTGKVAFDKFGDSKTRVLTTYKVVDGKWKADKTEEFK